MYSVRRSNRKRKPSTVLATASSGAAARKRTNKQHQVTSTSNVSLLPTPQSTTPATTTSWSVPCVSTTMQPNSFNNHVPMIPWDQSLASTFPANTPQVPEVSVSVSDPTTTQQEIGNLPINLSHFDTSPPPPIQLQSVHNDLATNVSHSLKEKICKGEYVDIGLLLDNSHTKPSTSKLTVHQGELVLQPQNQKKVSSIEQWTSAFIVYCSIYVTVHPNRIQELLKYMHVIRLAAERSTMGWRLYDEQFRLRKANDPSSSWSVIDTELWLFYIQGDNNANSGNIHTNRPFPNLKCYGFNYVGSCYKYNCSYSHTCMHCSGFHPVKTCNVKQVLGATTPEFRNRPIGPLGVSTPRFSARPNLSSNFGFRQRYTSRPRSSTFSTVGHGSYAAPR